MAAVDWKTFMAKSLTQWPHFFCSENILFMCSNVSLTSVNGTADASGAKRVGLVSLGWNFKKGKICNIVMLATEEYVISETNMTYFKT